MGTDEQIQTLTERVAALETKAANVAEVERHALGVARAIRDARSPVLSVVDKAILWALASRLPNPCPSFPLLAEDAGCSVRAAKDSVSRLRQAGVVLVGKQPARGYGSHNTYDLDLDALAALPKDALPGKRKTRKEGPKPPPRAKGPLPEPTKTRRAPKLLPSTCPGSKRPLTERGDVPCPKCKRIIAAQRGRGGWYLASHRVPAKVV